MYFIKNKNKNIQEQKNRIILLQKKINTIKEENNILQSYYSLNKQFLLKSNYNSIIPLNLYTCWHTKELPPLMKENYHFLIDSNPKIKFHLYDENECREFIKENFSLDVLEAYNSLIPCSYKSDLWRYCILYKNGGIYMDIKYKCVNGFKFISLTEKEYFVRDYIPNGTYTALIVSKPNNEILYKCIRQIVQNVKNRYYGNTSLDPTGPGLLGNFFTNDEKKAMEIYHDVKLLENKLNKFFIVKDNSIILSFYEGYREEQQKYQKFIHYSQLWEEKKIYI